MSADHDHLAQVAQLRALAGRELPIHQRLIQIVDAIQRLEAGARCWRAFAPQRTAVDDSIVQADAIARALRELRSAQHSDGAHDA